MDDPRSLEAQLLGDMTYDDPRKKQQPQAQQPAVSPEALLGDMGSGMAPPPPPQNRYQELTDEQVAILQQQRADAGQPPFTPEEIAELKAEFIERQRIAAQEAAMAQQAASQQQAAALLLENPDTYQAPEKKPEHGPLPTVDASALLEEPAPEPEHRPAFNQEDIEAAKKQAAKRAAEALTTQAPPTDEKEARRQMRELREQQLADLAQAGFPVSIIVTIIGVVAGICMAFFAGRPWGGEIDPDSVTGLFKFMGTFYTWGGVILALLSVTIVLRVAPLRGFTSFLFGLSAFLLLLPGIVMLFEKRGEGFALTVGLYILAIVGCAAVTFVISTSDKLSAYYAHKDIIYD